MADNQPTSRRRIKLSTIIVMGFGLLLLAVALLATQVTLVGLEPWNGGHILLILLGLLIIAIAIFDKPKQVRWMGKAYRNIALTLLNVILMIAILELLVILSANISLLRPDRALQPGRQELPYYGTTDWGATYWEEHEQVTRTRYEPYVMWRRTAFEGETINVSLDGIRLTPGTQCDDEDAYRVYMYGGSTLWGVGAPDWETIPALLQPQLEELTGRPVCIVNYGEWGYVVLQNAVQLTLNVQQGDIPDLVIFYDGLNDVFATYQSGDPVQQNREQIAGQLEGDNRPTHPVVRWLLDTYTFEAFIQLLPAPEVQPQTAEGEPIEEIATEDLADRIIENYLSTQGLVDNLAADYGFDYVMLWQPSPVVSDRRLTPDEAAIVQAMAPGWRELSTVTYAQMADIAPDTAHLYDISGALDEADGLLWIDALHIIPEGNAIIADRIFDIITPVIRDDTADSN